MGFIESFLGSGLANAVTLRSIGDAFKEQSAKSHANVKLEFTEPPTGIGKKLLEQVFEKMEDMKYKEALPLIFRAIELDPLRPTNYV